jgi:drug/metabolite transporter (DMT)-like permease
MSKTQLGLLLVIVLSLLGVLADTILKIASAERHFFVSRWLFAGLALSCVFALGWLFLMRIMKLATAGMFCGVASALLLCIIGVVFFEERLTSREVSGIAMAAVAMVLLSRFS